jgi:MFS family permease
VCLERETNGGSGEYPAGSVACAESTGELKEGHRNRWFILFTNTQIDLGFVVAALVPMIVILATTEAHLEAAWRIMLGIGIIPPLSLLYLRVKLEEPEEFKRESIKSVRDTPWLLVMKFYGWRLFIVSMIWFVYDFNAYAFSVYSTTFLGYILPSTAPLWQTFGWNTVINLFYMPGAIAGSFISDWIGPKKTLAIFVLVQGLVGFLMAGLYPILNQPQNVGGFVVIYGFFLAFGEVGPGDNIGLIASKTCATAVRGKYYAVAAAMGKIGAFIGTQIFPIVISNAPNTTRAGQDPFFIASSLCMFAAALAFFCLPHIGQDTITEEDLTFREYLASHGYDTNKMGLGDHNRRISVVEIATVA